jgi:DNA-3-methyladenine glycosylase II
MPTPPAIQFNNDNFHSLCDSLTREDSDLRHIIEQYGYPPMWTRPNKFETLVLTILEQQISLAAAYAAFQKLKDYIGAITPKKILAMTDEELRACYFTRQKTGYVRGLAQAILSKQINLKAFEHMEDGEVRRQLKALKGIGDWTVDIYLIHVLRHTDVFPLGDLALLNGVRMLKENKELTKEEIEKISLKWKPYRTIATMLVWHYYIKKKNIKLLH